MRRGPGETPIDTRPEGNMLLTAKLIGLWQEVLTLAQFAATAGCVVTLDESKGLQKITVTTGE